MKARSLELIILSINALLHTENAVVEMFMKIIMFEDAHLMYNEENSSTLWSY